MNTTIAILLLILLPVFVIAFIILWRSRDEILAHLKVGAIFDFRLSVKNRQKQPKQ